MNPHTLERKVVRGGRFSWFSHFGTREQAGMRAARSCARIIEVTTTATRFKRMVDSGSWNRKALEALERQDYDGVVYLNRYEGVPLEAFELARKRGIDLDRVRDEVFRREVPDARDSYIIFDPLKVRVVQPEAPAVQADGAPAVDQRADRPVNDRELEVVSLRM